MHTGRRGGAGRPPLATRSQEAVRQSLGAGELRVVTEGEEPSCKFLAFVPERVVGRHDEVGRREAHQFRVRGQHGRDPPVARVAAGRQVVLDEPAHLLGSEVALGVIERVRGGGTACIGDGIGQGQRAVRWVRFRERSDDRQVGTGRVTTDRQAARRHARHRRGFREHRQDLGGLVDGGGKRELRCERILGRDHVAAASHGEGSVDLVVRGLAAEHPSATVEPQQRRRLVAMGAIHEARDPGDLDGVERMNRCASERRAARPHAASLLRTDGRHVRFGEGCDLGQDGRGLEVEVERPRRSPRRHHVTMSPGRQRDGWLEECSSFPQSFLPFGSPRAVVDLSSRGVPPSACTTSSVDPSPHLLILLRPASGTA